MSMVPHTELPSSPPEVNLRDFLDILRRRRLIVLNIFVTVFLVGVLATPRSKPVYTTSAKLIVPSRYYGFSFINSNNPFEAMLAAAQPDDLYTQLEVLQNPDFVQEAIRKAGVTPKPNIAAPSVSVEQVKNSNVIQVTVTGGSPRDIAKVANAVVDLHLEKTDLLTTTGLKDTKEFVQQEKDKTQKRLAGAERRLIAFRRDHRIVALTTQQEADAKELVALQVKVRETESNSATAKAQIETVRARLGQEPIDLVREGVKDNPRRAKLEDRLDEMGFKRADLLREFRPASREVLDVDREIARLQRQLESEPEVLRVRTHEPNPARAPLQTRLVGLETDLQGYLTAHNAAVAQLATKKNTVDDLAPWEIQLGKLTNERDSTQSAYNELSNQLRDLELRTKARVRTARAIERAAIPTAPLPSHHTTGLVFSAVLALLLAVGTALLQENLDDRINSPEDLKQLSTLPVLAHVPLIGQGQSRLIAALPAKSHVAEAYRALRSGIGFVLTEGPVRRLLVTSASPGEGKSVTAVNLATAMAYDGKKVILVDADLRRPSIHEMLGLPSSPGFSELLAATARGEGDLDAALHETEIENLSVLCAGASPPNPAELLGSRVFDTVLEQLQERADVILFDSPPCMPVTDPLLVAARMDGVVLVLGAGETRKGSVQQAVDLLTRARARIVGLVFNRVQTGRSGYYYYHHYGNGYYSDGGRRNGRHRRNGRDHKLERQEAKAIASSARVRGEEEDA